MGRAACRTEEFGHAVESIEGDQIRSRAGRKVNIGDWASDHNHRVILQGPKKPAARSLREDGGASRNAARKGERGVDGNVDAVNLTAGPPQYIWTRAAHAFPKMLQQHWKHYAVHAALHRDSVLAANAAG
jgi:hypothetical protein